MSEMTFYHWLVVAWMALAVATFVALFFVNAPYGRFTRSGWGPRINARCGWIIMETPVLAAFLVLYGLSDRKSNPVSLVMLAFWVVHYVHRSLIYPFRVRGSRPSITVSIIAMGAAFNVGNGCQIPCGGGYGFVSCPNYLGEMLEWGGWALACWNLGALAFFVWTIANLAPRAIKTHRWYGRSFPTIPRSAERSCPSSCETRPARWPALAPRDRMAPVMHPPTIDHRGPRTE